MKKTYLMLLLALAELGSSCTNEDGTAGRANPFRQCRRDPTRVQRKRREH